MEENNKINKKRGKMKFKNIKKNETKRKEGASTIQGDKRAKRMKVFKICLFTFIALCVVGTGVIVGVLTGIIDKTPGLDPEELQMLDLTTHVYDSTGENEIGAFYAAENREIVRYESIPQHLIDAIVSIEDERFFTHKGIDIKRSVAAVGTFILNGGSSNFGGSTITQQLVKNTTKDKEGSWQRKIREWYRAILLEKALNKEQIFESYVTTIYLGDGAYGIEVASENYFGKPVSDINIAEAATLAAIVQSPEVTNPYKSEEAKEKLLARKDLVLKQMLKFNKITQEEYDEAKTFEIAFKKEKVENTTAVQSYFVDAVFEQVKNDLMEAKNIDSKTAENMLYTRGYKIYTTQDINVQKAIDDAYNNDKLFYTDKQGHFMQSAMVVMDQSNGNIVGLIGGAGEKNGARVLNRATSQPRQPGSCMKPFGAYGPAFEQGVLSPGAGIDDSQLTTGTYNPGNYYGYFNGYVTARDAINRSMNLPAVRANMRVDINYAYNFAKNCGLDNLDVKDKNSASLALGGVTKGFSVLEMANAYATIANGGVHVEPKLYTKVVDKDGKEVLVTKTVANKAMEESTAYMLTDSLRTVVTNGTAAGSVSTNGGKIATAGKTGNTNDDFDQWFCGYTPYYTIACWNGYDDLEKKAIFGPHAPKRGYPYDAIRLFNTVMNSICKDKPAKQFEKPNSITTASLCKVSGLVSTDACRKDQRGDQTGTDIVAVGKIPTATCNIHKLVKVCDETGLIAREFCPKTSEKSFITRDGVPTVKPGDWKFMLPTESCNKHTTKPVEEKPDDKNDKNDVNIYTDTNKNNGSTNKPT